MAVIHSHFQAVIPLSLTEIKLKPVVAQAGFLPLETLPLSKFAMRGGANGRGMQVTDSHPREIGAGLLPVRLTPA
jgi:hypothetical protein